MIDIRAGTCVFKGNKMLLLQSVGNTEYGKAGDWGPPGGHGEVNETFEQTALRETLEEAGINVTLTGIVQAGFIMRENSTVFLILYSAKVKSGQKIKLQKEEVIDYKWVTRNEIGNDVYPLRNKLLKASFLKAFDEKPSPLNTILNMNM